MKTESYKMVIMDFTEQGVKMKPFIKEWEIWSSCHPSTGQGGSPTISPIFWGIEKASTFETACLKWELRSKLESVDNQDRERVDMYNHNLRNGFITIIQILILG